MDRIEETDRELDAPINEGRVKPNNASTYRRRGYKKKLSEYARPVYVRHEMRGLPLTRRQLQILQMIADDMTSKTIAGKIHRSVRTIHDHKYQILMKLGKETITGAVADALRKGWIK